MSRALQLLLIGLNALSVIAITVMTFTALVGQPSFWKIVIAMWLAIPGPLLSAFVLKNVQPYDYNDH